MITDIAGMAVYALALLVLPAAAFAAIRYLKGSGRHRPAAGSPLTATGEGWCLNHPDPLWHGRREECPNLRNGAAR